MPVKAKAGDGERPHRQADDLPSLKDETDALAKRVRSNSKGRRKTSKACAARLRPSSAA